MAEPITRERLDNLERQWAGVLSEYPTLQKYGPRPFDETGFDPRAAREYKHLRSRSKPTPQPPAAFQTQPPAQQEAPAIPNQVTPRFRIGQATAVPGQQQQYPDAYMPEAKDQWMSGEYIKDIGSSFARGVGGLVTGALPFRKPDTLKHLGRLLPYLSPLKQGAQLYLILVFQRR